MMVRGMGRAFSRVIGVAVTVITVVVISACGAPAPKGPNAFARRASFDLNCPVEQLDFVPIKESSPRTYGVIGCHRRTTYTEACSTAGVWLRNWRSCSPADAWLWRGEREVHRGIPAIGQGEGPEPQDVFAGVDLPA